jgi:hypothetical protein
MRPLQTGVAVFRLARRLNIPYGCDMEPLPIAIIQ